MRPMLAMLAEAPLADPHLAYEPKYDGIRALIEVEAHAGARGVTIWSRLGNEKTGQFPEIVAALGAFSRKLKATVLLDGEIVALEPTGEPTGFQALQGRIHVVGPRPPDGSPVAFIAFDVLRDGADDLRPLPLTARRARLERILGNVGSPVVRLSRFVPADGHALYRHAVEHGGEGLIAKQLDAPYRSGRRSAEWRKIKLVREQEFVVGGWTEPRRSRTHFGALLLGVWEDGALTYVGHTGTGFSEAELRRVHALLRARAIERCPFRARPRTNERPHWVRPELVAEVKFTEWTADGKLRHPIYVGLRDDVKPDSIRREPAVPAPPAPRGPARRARREPALDTRDVPAPLAGVMERLADIEARGGAGTVALPDGQALAVGKLDKALWPSGITKGELMRYYVRVSPWLLPVVADRPLVMRRFPNGIRGKAFYQQRAPARVPRGVRVEVLPSDEEVPSRLVGGALVTLLYMVQLAVISQDPWFSRVQSPDFPDHVALDLDPMPGVRFADVLDVARWIRDELGARGIIGVPKTSGAEGLHVYVPLPPRTTYESARLFAEILATLVADKHGKTATVTRAVHARGRTVYVDYLQNLRTKTLAAAYSVRANDLAGVSTPLTWDEVDRGVDRRDFTIHTTPARLRAVGDLWAALREAPPANLKTVLR